MTKKDKGRDFSRPFDFIGDARTPRLSLLMAIACLRRILTILLGAEQTAMAVILLMKIEPLTTSKSLFIIY